MVTSPRTQAWVSSMARRGRSSSGCSSSKKCSTCIAQPAAHTAGAACAGAVEAEHLRGGPAVQLHQVTLRTAAVQPGVAEMVPEPVREYVHAALGAAAGDHLVDAAGGQRPPIARPEPQLRPACLRMPGAD